MKKTGYLTKKKVDGKVYLYVRKSYREGNNVKNQYLYSFGKMPDALNKMYEIRETPDIFPKELLGHSFDLNDIDEWILTIETGVTSTGRNFDVSGYI